MEMRPIMKIKTTLMWSIVLLLLFVDWITFHDIFESHTIRDWLTLLTSVLVFLYFLKDVVKFK